MNKETNDKLNEILDIVKNNKCNCVSIPVEKTVLPPSVKFAAEEHLKKTRLRKVQEKVDTKQEENKVLNKSEISELSTGEIVERLNNRQDGDDKDRQNERLNLLIELWGRRLQSPKLDSKKFQEVIRKLVEFRRQQRELNRTENDEGSKVYIIKDGKKTEGRVFEDGKVVENDNPYKGSYKRFNDKVREDLVKERIQKQINNLQNNPFDVESAQRLAKLQQWLLILENKKTD